MLWSASCILPLNKLRRSGDTVETVGLDALLRGQDGAKVVLRITKPTGETVDVPVEHTMSRDQVNWFLAGMFSSHEAVESR